MDEDFRDKLGRRVREIWINWAKEQKEPKKSWLIPYDKLNEKDKEVDRRIGCGIWFDCVAYYQEIITEKIIEELKNNDNQR